MTWRSVLGSTLLIVLGLYAVAFALLLSLTPLAAVFGGLSPTFEVLDGSPRPAWRWRFTSACSDPG